LCRYSLDLAEVGPDVNGAELMGTTPLPSPSQRRGRRSVDGVTQTSLVDKEGSPERNTSQVQVVIKVEGGGDETLEEKQNSFL
jgi:hypothetical protein